MKDLTSYLSPNLDLKLGDRTYSVPPPTKDAGLKLATIVAVGLNAYRGLDSPAETVADFKKIENTTIAELALGPAHDQMVADGVPAVHIDRAGVYAMYFWTVGEEAADQIITAIANEAAGIPAPKGSRARRTGPSTASASPTSTASTRGTGSRPPTADRRPRATRASRGKTSSTAGD